MGLFAEIIGEGTPVVLLHGYGVDHRLMKGCFEPVFQNRPGYRRIYIDLPGMGRSTAGDVQSADDMLAAVAAFIDTVVLAGQPFLLAGESYGGYLAQGLLAMMPARVLGVLLLCSVVVPDREKRRVPRHVVLSDTLTGRQDKALLKKFDEYAVVRTPDALHRYARDVLPGIEAGDRAFVKEFFPRRYGFESTPAFGCFDKPGLVIAGRQDSTVGYEDAYLLLEKLPRATFAVLDMAGHNLQIEQPALFTALTAEWLGRVTAHT